MTETNLVREVQRRRTFAIISHPDAGKTTLTEKLLLYGGCVEIAGAVRGRKTERAATSDWMELEKQRGISVSSTVLSFEYADCQINLLDTPGHHDFSEDTYRTLMAADAAVMVIDLAKGVEAQTEKLFRVCALRKIPVLTFVNKVDRPGREPLAIIEEIETRLGIAAAPYNWPLGTGSDFHGVVEVESGQAHIYHDRSRQRRITAQTAALHELRNADIPASVLDHAEEDLALLRELGAPFDPAGFLRGEFTPVFFGSALTNFGVQPFLEKFLQLCPPPANRMSEDGPVEASQPLFSAFVFKIQANLDPRHRDRVAFVRVCSGRFQREMEVLHPRSGKRIKLPRAHRVFGPQRETMDEAFPGDIIGLVNPGEFQLGDTICEGPAIHFEPLPQFSPEFFATLRTPDTSRRKQFARGLNQLIEEGAIQVFLEPGAIRREPILAAVGQLQFDVVKYRLESEYNTQTEIDWLPYKCTRWFADPEVDVDALRLPYGALVVTDQHGHPAVLFRSQRDAEYGQRQNINVPFVSIRTGKTQAMQRHQRILG